jgi:hypothetical protein
MNAREELLKITLGRTVTGLLLLVALLIGVIWREALSQKWVQATEGLSKPALAAMLELALLVVVAEALGIAYLGYLLYQSQRVKVSGQIPQLDPPKLKRLCGVLWAEDASPICPVCEILLHLFIVYDEDSFREGLPVS